MSRMSRSRKDTQETLAPPLQRPLRVVASGTLFLTHTLSLPSHPEPASAVRAHSVTRTRGGSASTCLSILAQFPNVDAMLVAPLGGNEEGQMIIRDLESERVSTRFCKIWEIGENTIRSVGQLLRNNSPISSSIVNFSKLFN